MALLYFYLTLGFETSATWQSRERLIEAVSIGTRQADFDAKALLLDYLKTLSVLELCCVETSSQEGSVKFSI